MEFEFAKNATVDDVNKVPEPFRGFYSDAGDGTYTIADSFKASAASVDGLNRALRNARKDADESKKNRPDVAPYQGLASLLGLEDNTPDALKSGIEGLLDKVSKGDQGKVNWDKMKNDLERAHNTALQAKDGELSTMHGTLVKYLVESEAVRAIAEHKGVPEFLLPQIKQRTKVVKDGDTFHVRVVDDSGDPRGNASGGFMSIGDLVKELKADKTFGRAFESDANSGSGKQPSSSQQRTPQQQAPMNPTSRIAKGLSNNG